MPLSFSVAAVARKAVAATGRWAARLDRALERLDEPRVDGRAFACGGGLDPLLQALGEPEGDAGRERLVGRLGRPVVFADEDELEVVAGDAQLDVRGLELVVELERRFGEGVLHSPAEGRLDRNREEVGRTCRVLVTESRNTDEVLAERLGETVDLHGGTMTSR